MTYYGYGGAYSLSDTEILEDIGEKIRKIRLKANITRDELHFRTGIHKKTIGDAEIGRNITMMTLIGILRGLNAFDLLEPLLKEEEVSPVALAMNKGRSRERARK
ncbi:MAG: helix-turn-helix domain-containing protein [Methanomassiliicoccaceae archaeon]|jgi:transcriptional regulator with XRE-family HTH domain|nr:helix-turn-helix domain-containing protein [Methanomassiliicoccaceae archaeon]